MEKKRKEVRAAISVLAAPQPRPPVVMRSPIRKLPLGKTPLGKTPPDKTSESCISKNGPIESNIESHFATLIQHWVDKDCVVSDRLRLPIIRLVRTEAIEQWINDLTSAGISVSADDTFLVLSRERVITPHNPLE